MVIFRECAGLAQNRSADFLSNIRGVMVTLDQCSEAWLQLRSPVANCGLVGEPVVVDLLAERLPRNAGVVLAQDVVLVLAVA